MVVPLSEMTAFYNDGTVQKLTGTYDVYDNYIGIQIRDEHDRKLWHDIIIPMHAIVGFEAHNQPRPLYMVNV